jgi:nitrogen fixation protein NifX
MEAVSSNDIKGVLKVAFATNDTKNVDAHFGGAKQFYVYNVNSTMSDLSYIVNIHTKDTDETIAKLHGVDIVYFVDIGAIAAAKVINSGIFPIKYKDIINIDSEIDKLKEMLGTNPPPFIKKIIEKKEV